MGNRYIRFPHSNWETRTGGFMDILEKWSVIGILFLEVMDLPTTGFPLSQHTNLLGWCFGTSVCLYCMQHQRLSFALISRKAQRRKSRSPAMSHSQKLSYNTPSSTEFSSSEVIAQARVGPLT